MKREYRENLDGVHAFDGEYSLCGDAFDAPESERDWESGPFKKTRKRTITCVKCAAVILFCRGIRVNAAIAKRYFNNRTEQESST